MPQISGIYDSAPIQPIAKWMENLSVLTSGRYSHYKILFVEPLPPGPASIVDMVVASGATGLAAGGAIAAQIVAILQLNEPEVIHLRFEPLDNVEGIIWQQAGQAKFRSRNIQARVNRMTRFWDPYLATTTFWILGQNRDMNLQVQNNMGYATPVARFLFWGYRYLLEQHTFQGASAAEKNLLGQGDMDTVKKHLGQTTWVPAEGRQS